MTPPTNLVPLPTALARKASGTVTGKKPAAPNSPTPAPKRPVADPSAWKTSASTSTNGAAVGNESSNNHSSHRPVSSGSDSTKTEVKPPAPPTLIQGIKLGHFLSSEDLSLPQIFPSLRERTEQAAKKRMEQAAKKRSAGTASTSTTSAGTATTLPTRPVSQSENKELK